MDETPPSKTSPADLIRICRGGHTGPCPLLSGSPAPRTSRHHGIVVELDLDDPAQRAALRRLRAEADPGEVTAIPRVSEAFRAQRLSGTQETTHQGKETNR